MFCVFVAVMQCLCFYGSNAVFVFLCSTPEASRTGDGLGVQTTTGNTSVRRSLLNSFSQGNSGLKGLGWFL